MATRTKNLMIADGGLFTVDFDYDDVLLRILSVSVVNATSRAWTVVARSTTTDRTYTIPIAPGTNQELTVPAGAANRLDLSVTPSGKLDGVEWSVS
jgi:hypothetical protein